MTNELILREDNIRLVMSQAPQAWRDNQLSHDRCLASCQSLLDTIEAEGMNDELDQKADTYIRKSRNTVKKMNEQRSAVTKLFDEIRTVFTTLENDVDPTKKGSVPYQLQEYRNAYAAHKQREAEAARQAELRKQRMEMARTQYRQDVETDYRQQFNRYLTQRYNELTALNDGITLQNFAEREQQIRAYDTRPRPELFRQFPSGVRIPADLSPDEAKAIREQVVDEVVPKFCEQYDFDLSENAGAIIAMLPSKRKELEAIAQASAEEAAKRTEELKRREAEEAARREQERIRREQEERERQQVQKQQAEMAGLFEQAKAAAPTYQPKAQAKKRIVVTDPRGFLDILNLWWTTEGVTLGVEELAKKFKSQLTHCERLANDKQDPRFIQSEYIQYEDEIKAK